MQDARGLVVATYQGGLVGGAQGVKAAGQRALTRDLPQRLLLTETLQVKEPQVAAFKEPANELARLGGDHNRVGFSNRLCTRSKVWRLTHGVVFAAVVSRQGRAYHRQTRGQADAYLRCVWRLPWRARQQRQAGQAVDDRQGCAHRLFGVMLVRNGVAKVSQHAVAQILRNPALVALHELRQQVAKVVEVLAQVFGVDPGRQRRGADEVAKHHRDGASLQGGCAAA